MRNAKIRGNAGGAGAEKALGPVNFAVGSVRSRAAARMLAEQVERESERSESNQRVKDPWQDPKARFEISRENLNTGGAVIHVRCIPAGRGAEDAGRFLDGDE